MNEKASSERTAHLLRVTTTVVFLLLGASAFMVSSDLPSNGLRTIFQSIGSFLVGTIVVGYAYEYFLNEETENRTIGKLDKVLAQRVDSMFPGAATHGFRGFATEVPRSSFEGLERGDELLWLDTYSPDLMLFVPSLQAALQRGVSVRMLVIDPDCLTAQMRAAEIAEVGYDEARFADGAKDFLGVISSAARDLDETRGRLEIRCYQDLPCIPMYLRIRSGQALTGITGYFLAQPSFNAVHLCWAATPDGMLASFHRYFERKWEGQPTHFKTATAASSA